MGKSGKKIKSDTINALRKHYDAFLEEDKKRRVRNEYILERLENMRLSTTVAVPNRHKKIQLSSDYQPYSNRKHRREYYETLMLNQNIPVLEPNTDVKETLILKELSQKYIMIPKFEQAHENENSYALPTTKNISDVDWKSKYNILHELKRNEIESVNKKSEFVGLNEDNGSTKNIVEPSLLTLNKDSSLINNNLKRSEITNVQVVHLPDNKSHPEVFAKTEYIIQNDAQHIEDSCKYEEIKTKLYGQETLESEDTNINMIDNITNNFSTVNSEKVTEPIECKNLLQEKNYISTFKNENQQEIEEANTDQADNNLLLTMKVEHNSEHDVNDTNVVELSEGNENYDNESNEGNPNWRGESEVEVNKSEEGNIDSRSNYEHSEGNYETGNFVAENQNYINEDYTYYDESQQAPLYINEHEETTEDYDPNYQQQYSSQQDDHSNESINQQYEVENPHEQGGVNLVYDGQPGDGSYDYVNTENVEITEPNYENESKDSPQYSNDLQQEYSSINKAEYEQQNYNKTEASHDIEKQLESEEGYAENTIINQNYNSQNITNVESAENIL